MSDRNAGDADDSRAGILSQQALEIAVYLLVLIWAVYLLLQVPSWRRNDKLFPLLFGIPLVVLVIVKLLSIRHDGILETVGLLREDPADSSESADATTGDPEESPGVSAAFERTELVAIGWPIGLLVLIYLIGFSYAVPIFLFGAVYHHLSDVKWATVITVAISVPIFFFEFTQGYLLWEGILFR